MRAIDAINKLARRFAVGTNITIIENATAHAVRRIMRSWKWVISRTRMIKGLNLSSLFIPFSLSLSLSLFRVPAIDRSLTIGSDYLRSLRFSENFECVRNDDNDRSYLSNRCETTTGERDIKRVFTVFLVKADARRNVGNAFYFFYFFSPWNIYTRHYLKYFALR